MHCLFCCKKANLYGHLNGFGTSGDWWRQTRTLYSSTEIVLKVEWFWQRSNGNPWLREQKILDTAVQPQQQLVVGIPVIRDIFWQANKYTTEIVLKVKLNRDFGFDKDPMKTLERESQKILDTAVQPPPQWIVGVPVIRDIFWQANKSKKIKNHNKSVNYHEIPWNTQSCCNVFRLLQITLGRKF